jgi:putative hydroxymethylpyrimidine transport system permease protein
VLKRYRATGVVMRYRAAGALLAGLLLIWEGACRWLGVPAFILPAPSRIAQALWAWRGPLLTEHLPVTAAETLLGLGISILLGVGLAVGMHLFPPLYRALYPLVVASQTIPVIAVSPVFLFWFGYSLSQKVAVVVLITFFPIAIGTFDGLRSADPDLLDWLRTAGASRWRVLQMAEAPSALPAFFTSLRVAAPVSVIGAVIGEWLGGQSGLGVFGRRAASTLKSAELFASVVVLALFGILLVLLVGWMERALLSYRRSP